MTGDPVTLRHVEIEEGAGGTAAQTFVLSDGSRVDVYGDGLALGDRLLPWAKLLRALRRASTAPLEA